MIIRFDEENKRFNYRVIGVAVHQDFVLLHQGAGEDFWTLPGGRAEFGEPAEQTLKREMREELGAEVEVVRPLWFVENFFTYASKHYHEIALYFLIRFAATSEYLIKTGPFRGKEAEPELTFQWFARRPDVLSGLPLLPSFLQTAIQKLPDSVQHVIQRDEPQV